MRPMIGVNKPPIKERAVKIFKYSRLYLIVLPESNTKYWDIAY